jgi:ubiquinone/menaquinone biosynthesis C-methylase UbiE
MNAPATRQASHQAEGLTGQYLLAGGAAELERIQFQAWVWEPAAEAMLDRIGVQPGWDCIDLGCGGMGILGPLSRRVGPTGRVVGLDQDAQQLATARAFVHQHRLENVAVVAGDAYGTGLPRASFDLVHVRFVFAPTGRDEALLREMLALARPSGIIVIQEPDAASWACYPPRPAWDRLTGAIQTALAQGGGDFNAGRRTYQLLRQVGLRDVQARAAVLALHDCHPYMRAPIQLATSLRQRIVAGGILDEDGLDATLRECEQITLDPGTLVTSFTVTQVWGRVPEACIL